MDGITFVLSKYTYLKDYQSEDNLKKIAGILRENDMSKTVYMTGYMGYATDKRQSYISDDHMSITGNIETLQELISAYAAEGRPTFYKWIRNRR